MNQDEKDKLMDHEYDGIQEFDNNLPTWWLHGFYFTIAFAFVYVFLFHIVDVAPSMEQEYRNEMFQAYVKYNPEEYLAGISGLGASNNQATVSITLKTDPQSIEAGNKIFHGKNLCYTCHGQLGEGIVGPNLTDDYWINGSQVEALQISIRKGFPDKGMMPFGSGQKINQTDMENLISYLFSIRGSNPPNAKPIDPSREKLVSEDETKSDN